MKVAVIFDGASALGSKVRSPDLLILETVEAVERALAGDGHEATRIPVNPDARWFERVRKGKFDLVFNLCEGVDGVAALEPAVVAGLELIGVAHTGSSAWTLALCLRKHLVNGLLDRAHLPVPRFALVRPGGALPVVGYPAICKPAAEDASLGVEQRSVVRSGRALAERVRAMHERWSDVLVQRFIDGREVNVGVIGDQVLPVAEIDFERMPAEMWRIVSYRSKWEEGSDEDLGAVPRCPADLPDELTAELQRIALGAWRLVGGGGYGRVDFRIDAAGRPWLLEVNANPDISPRAGLARMARVAGMDYAAMISEICASAITRQAEAAPDHWAVAEALSGLTSGGAALPDDADDRDAQRSFAALGRR
jgi:D-alanine-D-alanine ligase